MSNVLKNMHRSMHRSRPVKSVAALRWGRWAHTISSRHQRIGSRHRFAVMRFLRQALPVFQSSHRWELKAWSLFPRINLAIRPILHQSNFKGAGVDRTFHTLLSRTRETREFRTQREREFRTAVDRIFKTQPRAGETSYGRADSDISSATSPAPWEARPTDSELRNITTVDSRSANRYFVPDLSSLARQSPLSRVFRRLARQGTETQGRTRLTKQAFDTTHRVVEEKRRIERYAFITTATAMRQEQTSRKILEQTIETQRKLEEQIAGFSKGRTIGDAKFGSSPTAAPEGFSIQQLTEQVIRRIDDQIVAHKERMGTLF